MNAPIEVELGDETPTALYRLYATDNQLLYVGITGSLPTRFTQHAAEKSWWPQVARKTVAWYPARADAMRAEYAAVQGEHPVHNRATPGLPPSAVKPGRRLGVGRIHLQIDALRARAAAEGLGTDQAIARHLGISPATLSCLIHGHASAGERFIAHALGAFRDLSFEDVFEISFT